MSGAEDAPGPLPQGAYPQGHPELADSLFWLGIVLTDQRAYGEAGYLERTLKMRRAYIPTTGIRWDTPNWPLACPGWVKCSPINGPMARHGTTLSEL